MTTVVEPRSTTLAINGLRMRVLEWGAAGAPPVVCVHGYTSSAEAFNAPARYLPGPLSPDRARCAWPR